METHRPWARFVIHQSLTTMVVKVRLSKSTLPSDEDLQYAVETKLLIRIIQDEQYVSWLTQQVALNQSHYCITCEKPGENFNFSINREFLAICSKSFRTNDTAECILTVYLLPTYKQKNLTLFTIISIVLWFYSQAVLGLLPASNGDIAWLKVISQPLSPPICILIENNKKFIEISF